MRDPPPSFLPTPPTSRPSHAHLFRLPATGEHHQLSWATTTAHLELGCKELGYCEQGILAASRYLASAYWAFTTLSTIGFGDITANTDAEKASSHRNFISLSLPCPPPLSSLPSPALLTPLSRPPFPVLQFPSPPAPRVNYSPIESHHHPTSPYLHLMRRAPCLDLPPPPPIVSPLFLP